MSFTKVRNRRLYEDIVQQIRLKISDGEYQPGDRLPTEQTIIKSIGVSKTSLREAFRVLEAEGLVISKQGGGRFVRAAKPGAFFQTTGVIGQLQSSQILDLMEARETIECKIAELAAERVRSEQIETLRTILDKMHSKSDLSAEGPTLFKLDRAFHISLAEASQNFVFVNWLRLSLEILAETRRRTLQLKGRREKLFKELQDILNAVELHDRQQAAASMRRHLQGVLTFIKKMAENENVPIDHLPSRERTNTYPRDVTKPKR